MAFKTTGMRLNQLETDMQQVKTQIGLTQTKRTPGQEFHVHCSELFEIAAELQQRLNKHISVNWQDQVKVSVTLTDLTCSLAIGDYTVWCSETDGELDKNTKHCWQKWANYAKAIENVVCGFDESDEEEEEEDI
jgi:translation initiation factor IF-1